VGHHGATVSTTGVLVPGEAARWIAVDLSEGLEHVREILRNLRPQNGLILSGGIGLTRHVAEVIRRAGVPARVGAARQRVQMS
jgi:signal transduction histidine kinase